MYSMGKVSPFIRFPTMLRNQHDYFRWVGFMMIFISALVVAYYAWRGYRNTDVWVEWTTASEMNTAGYNLFRSDHPDGPYIQVNERIIPASTDPLTGGSYKYLDRGVNPGRTYYYELEDIELSGTTFRHGPIEVKARRGGLSELIISIALFSLGIGLIINWHKVRRQNYASE